MKFVATAVILFLLAGHPAEPLPAVPSVDNSNGDHGRAERSTQDWERYGNTIYKYFPNEVDWSSAELTCQDENSGVVHIDDEEENKWILERTKHYGGGNIFILLPDEKMALRNGNGRWAPGEPNGQHECNIGGTYVTCEPCVEMLVKHFHGYSGGKKENRGKWNDIGCRGKMGFWCERDFLPGWTPRPSFPRWYRWEEINLNYYDARDFCINKGAYLAIISSEEENDFLKENAPNNHEYRVDLGDGCPDNPTNSTDKCLNIKSRCLCEHEPDLPKKKTTCDNTYLVSLNRSVGPYAYRIQYYEEMSTGSDLTTCQNRCNDLASCRSLTYYVNGKNESFCSTFKISLGGLLGTEREVYIQRHDTDMSKHPTLISYDRDCVN